MESSLSTMARLTARGFTERYAAVLTERGVRLTMRRSCRAREDEVDVFRGVALVAATITMGIMTGVFQLYAYAIMPGLGKTDDRTFVGAFQSIDRSIINPLFMVTFFGALVFTGLAALFAVRGDGRSVLPWVVVALVLYVLVVILTLAINVPLNDQLKAAGDPDRVASLAAARKRFDEAKWVRWNLVRAVASTVAFGCLTWALVLYGRATPDGA
jgi:uncharacterized membrane protein